MKTLILCRQISTDRPDKTETQFTYRAKAQIRRELNHTASVHLQFTSGALNTSAGGLISAYSQSDVRGPLRRSRTPNVISEVYLADVDAHGMCGTSTTACSR